MKTKIIKIIGILGFGVFIYLIFKSDPVSIWENIAKRMSWDKFLLLFSFRIVYWLFRTVCWMMVLAQYKSPAPFWPVFWARLATNSFSYVTPSAKIGGEAVRMLMLDLPSRRKTVASAIVDKTVEFMATILMIIVGVIAAVVRIDMPRSSKLAVMGSTVALIILFIFLFNKQRHGFFIWMMDSLKRIKLKIKFLEKNRDKIKETDTLISEFYVHHRKTFSLVFVLYVFMVIFWAWEIYMTFLFIGTEGLKFIDCFFIVTFGSFSLILPGSPGSVGIYEMTYVSLFALLGIKMEFGLAMALIRRAISILWAGIGFLPMIGKKRKKPFHQLGV